jgi:hypothetical protein
MKQPAILADLKEADSGEQHNHIKLKESK